MRNDLKTPPATGEQLAFKRPRGTYRVERRPSRGGFKVSFVDRQGGGWTAFAETWREVQDHLGPHLQPRRKGRYRPR